MDCLDSLLQVETPCSEGSALPDGTSVPDQSSAPGMNVGQMQLSAIDMLRLQDASKAACNSPGLHIVQMP